MKWTIAAFACFLAFARRHAPLYLAFAVLFTYFLFGDSIGLHETIGHRIAARLGLQDAFGLRAQDFGELAALAMSGAVLFSLIALAYWQSGDEAARSFTRLLLPWLGVLILCGVGVDMLHSLVTHFYLDALPSMILGVIEEGGEMIPASFLASICVREAFGLRQGVGEAASPN